MKLYKSTAGIIIEKESRFYPVANQDWDTLINADDLLQQLEKLVESAAASTEPPAGILPPIGSMQELWACGVTYLRSRVGRQEESKAAGGADFYARVYEAERPEVFFKSTFHRISGPDGFVRIRKDSTWDVPEPELTLVVSSSGKIIGYTIGNDMSSRSIEGENPLYLPQAKTYDGCAALGPCIYVSDSIKSSTVISIQIKRGGIPVFEGSTSLNQMKRTPEELVSYVFRECSFPYGCLIMTGTGIVPGSGFTLQSGDEIVIETEGIGILRNIVQ